MNKVTSATPKVSTRSQDPVTSQLKRPPEEI